MIQVSNLIHTESNDNWFRYDIFIYKCNKLNQTIYVLRIMSIYVYIFTFIIYLYLSRLCIMSIYVLYQ